MLIQPATDHLLVACDKNHRQTAAVINDPATSNDHSLALTQLQTDVENRMVVTHAATLDGMQAKARTLRRLMSGGDEPQDCPEADDIARMTWSLVTDVLGAQPITLDVPAMALGEAAALFDALRTVKDVVLGLCCQPRFKADEGLYNQAGNCLDDLAEMIGRASDEIAERAEAAKPDQASDDYADRATILIMHDFHCAGVTTAVDRAIDLYGKSEAA